jgi:hypothetical protein
VCQHLDGAKVLTAIELKRRNDMTFARRALAVAALALTITPVALAAQPVVTITPFDRTRTIAASAETCAFPIIVHSEGTLRETVFESGRVMTTVSNFHISWTNPESGKSVTSVLGGPVIIEPNGDGTVTVTINGNDGLFAAPGIGIFFGAVGHLVYIANADDPLTPLVVLQSTGHQDASPFPAVCEALA